MTNFSAAYPGANIGPHYRHPRLMQPYHIPENKLSQYSGTGLSTFDTAGGGAFVVMGTRGARVDTNYTAGVAKQIVSLTGPHLIAGFVGPSHTGSSFTCTMEMIADGVSHSKALTVSADWRAGFIAAGFNKSSIYTTADDIHKEIATTGLTDTGTTLNNETIIFMPWQHMITLGIPLLYVDSTFVLNITHSAGTSDGDDRETAILYRSLA
jgi:hypothetical protein